MMDIFITWIVVMVSQVFTYVKTHHIVCFKHIQFIYIVYRT